MRRKRSSPTHIMFLHSLWTHLFYLLLPLIIFSAVALFSTIHDQTDRAQTTANMTAQMLADYTDNLYMQSDSLRLSLYTTKVYGAVLAILKSDEITYDSLLNLKMISPWLRAMSNANPLIDSIYLFAPNENGYFLSSVGQNIGRLSAYYDTGWYEQCMAHTKDEEAWIALRTVSQYQDGGLPESKQISVFRSFAGGRCYIIMNISAEALAKSLRSSCTYDGQEIVLMDDQGVLLSTSENNDFTLDPALLKSAMQTPQQITAGRYLQVLRPVWSDLACLVVSLPKTAIYQHAYVQLVIYTLMLITCIVLCIILAARYAHREQKKLTALYNLVKAAPGPEQEKALKPYDIYGYIEQNMVAAFMRQNALEIELQKKNYAMKSMELLALQAQINPHFLVNTINTVIWMTLDLTDGEPNAPFHMLEDLNELVGFLTGNPNEMISWEQELSCMRSYISIQKQRYSGRFVYEEEIDETCLNLLIAKLLLQPVLENCFVHAMPAEGLLHIRVQIQITKDGWQHITVDNDGIPMPEETLQTLRAHLDEENAYRHIGLYNVAKRLTLLYGVERPLTIESGPARGTRILIQIPIKPLDEINTP